MWLNSLFSTVWMCRENMVKSMPSSRDQAIYEVLLNLQKKNKEKYAKLILHMGGFHIAQNFLRAIGHLMQSTRIEDIMVEADVCLRGTANKSSVGKTTT